MRFDEVLHVALGLGENLAGVERFDLGDDRFPAISTASARRCSSTARSAGDMVAQPERSKAAAAAADCRVHVLRLHRANRGQKPAGAGVSRLEDLAVGGPCVLAADDRRQGRFREKRGNFIQQAGRKLCGNAGRHNTSPLNRGDTENMEEKKGMKMKA